jgi:outer membrane protein insertion porin family
MLLTAKPAGYGRNRCGLLLACVFVLPAFGATRSWSQIPITGESSAQSRQRAAQAAADKAAQSLSTFEGQPVRRISFEGVAADRLSPLPDRLGLAVGATLTREKLQSSMRQLYATGLFDDIQVEGTRDGDGVDVVIRGLPRTFIGTVTVDGAKGATVNTQLQRASQLAAGTRFTQAKMDRALEQMRLVLAQNGFNESKITQELRPRPADQLVDITFHVVSGPQSRVGSVEVSGDPGMTTAEFRRRARLHPGARVDHDTTNRAIDGVLKHYQKQERLEGEIKLDAQQYAPDVKRTNYQFTANRGPVVQVQVQVQGASLARERIKRLIPVFEEGTVDDDLLNEGNRRLRDYYQRLGYFDVKVDHQQLVPGGDHVLIVYNVQTGSRRHVGKVSIAGNHYFDAATLQDLLSVRAASAFDRHGIYSQALVSADVSALEAVYRNNGFATVKVTPETTAGPAAPGTSEAGSSEPLHVVYHVDEGPQQRVGAVEIEGAEHVNTAKLTPLLNTMPGQLLSPQNLAGDRDTLLTEYLDRGFDQAKIEVIPRPEASDPNLYNVTFRVTEGQQFFVRNVLLTGLEFTRPDTIVRAITVHAGDPLNQAALLETQRNLYEFALFNEIDTAVENPTGEDPRKTVLIQATEARRWVFTYGAGFEAQTGQPQNNCAGIISSGAKCNPEGKTGVSPRILGDLTRNNLFGREQSASILGTYGLLEQNINLLFQNPHFHGNRDFGLTINGGYANSQDVTTYVASKLEVGMRWTQHFSKPGRWPSKANTLIYNFDFRRVKVAASSLQVFPNEIAQLSAAVRVAGPGLTWIRDTRDSPMDARRGTYTSFQEFLSHEEFGAEVQFNRVDVSNSSYYAFDRGQIVLARNTRYGQERAFGDGNAQLIPLPERLYSGGPVSLRGFSSNAAGPRDPQTGFPIGGAAALTNSTELRLPPPTLPWLGDTVSFVLFHDMGNVFTNSSEAWPSAIRFHQPDRDACKMPQPQKTPGTDMPPEPTGPNTSTGVQGECSFNYFSHAPGVGLRYHTPVGPIRLDFSYNLNPPIFPVTFNYSNPTEPPHVGEASHFNFFFSLGQTF